MGGNDKEGSMTLDEWTDEVNIRLNALCNALEKLTNVLDNSTARGYQATIEDIRTQIWIAQPRSRKE